MAMHALDDRVSSSKPQVIKSFDKNRSGVLLGEGAAAIILKTIYMKQMKPMIKFILNL